MTKKRQSRATKVVLASILAASLSVPTFASADSISTSNNAAVAIAETIANGKVDFHVYKSGTTELQPAISGHIVPQGTIVEKDGKLFAELVVVEKSASMIAGLQTKQGEEFVDAAEVKNEDGTISYSFPLVADQTYAGKIHVVVPTANMDVWYDFDFKGTIANADVEVVEEIPVKVYKDGTNEESIMKNYIASTVTVAEAAGKNVVTMTFPKGHYIQSFKVAGKEATLATEDKATNERTYTFEVVDLSKLVNSEIHVIVDEAGIKYDSNHKVQLGFGDTKVEKPEEKPEEPIEKPEETPTPEKPSTTVNPFTDIEKDGNKDAILALYDKGIIKEATKFNPRNDITRAQFALMVARALDLKPTESAGFKDVVNLTDKERVNAIDALAEVGIVKKNDNFNPNKTLTRQQGALMLYRALNYKAGKEQNYGGADLAYYADGKSVTDEEAQKAFALLYEGKIMTGSKQADGKVLISANSSLKRTQMAKILNGSLEFVNR